MAEDVMTKAQAAQYLHISIATLERWTRAGLVPVVTLPGRRRVLFRKAALDQLLRDHERVATPAPRSTGTATTMPAQEIPHA
jgi:excisionase family DNA binding protein